MSKNGLHRHYDRLTPEERFRLDVMGRHGALDGLEREMAREGLSVWSAFAAFCDEEMGLDASKLLSALALPIAEKVRTLEEVAARLEVDPDDVEGYRESMGQVWHHALAKGA